MNVEIIYKDVNGKKKPVGWAIDADRDNQTDVDILNTIRNLQFFGFEGTAIKYNGRQGGDDEYAGKLTWIQDEHRERAGV